MSISSVRIAPAPAKAAAGGENTAMRGPPPPDPALGVFETLLVAGGEPVELGAHLERLRSSCAALYGEEPPAGWEKRAREHAGGLRLGRLRLTAVPSRATTGPGRRNDTDSGGLTLEITIGEVNPALAFPGPELAVALRSLPLPGGLGAHKWADRAVLTDNSAAARRRGRDRGSSPLLPQGEGALPLLLDDGAVLEAGNANLFAVVAGDLLTPPLDGRILPGIARGAVIELAAVAGIAVREERLGRSDLSAAAEVFLTNSVRGVQPVRSLDGAPLPAPGPVSRRLAASLRRRWRLAAAAAAPVPAAAPPPGPPAR